MEVIREYIEASRLMSVMTLPETFKNRKLEVIVISGEETARIQKKASEIDQAVQSLLGAVPYTDMSLSELREERLKKYESAD